MITLYEFAEADMEGEHEAFYLEVSSTDSLRCNMLKREPEIVILVADSKPTPKARKHILACFKANKCLNCGKEHFGTRGLGSRCYQKFRNQCLRMGPRKAAAYASKLARIGKILSPQEIRELKSDSSLDRIAQEV